MAGNVRELENVIQRAIIVRRKHHIGRLPAATCRKRQGDIVSIEDYHPAGSFEQQIRNYKIQLATMAVQENNGNKTLAARACIFRGPTCIDSFASPNQI